MAKAKKEKLSLEELLEQAIVKEEDRPYEVPENWVWTNLDTVAKYKKGPFGSAITKTMFVPKGQNIYKVYEQGNAIRKDKNYGSYYINEEKYQELKGFTVYPNDIIVSCAGTVGEVYQLPEDIEEGIINQALMRIKVSERLNLKYYLLYFGESLKTDINGKSKGTAIKNIPPLSILKSMPFPLPPYSEQLRSVTVIESLFEKLDKAKELVQNALDSFESRKAAILHKAFTGELTAKWREDNGGSLDSWEKTVIGKLCDCIVPSRDKPKSFTGTIPWITIPNIQENYIGKASAELFLTFDEIGEVKAKIIPKNSVIMSCVGRFGVSAIVMDECVINQQLHAFLPSDLINNRFLMYNIRYLKGYMKEKATSTTIAYLNKTACNSLPINLPTIDEQKEIVRILDNLLEKEQRAKELSDTIEKIDLMKKAILAKAFRGELGTNDPEGESAVELLKEILKEKIK